MNQTNKQVTSEIEVAAEAGADSRPVASSSRRRLIKLGGSAVPVLATLSSPSALAAACVSTSAWGSTQGVQNGSHTHRKVDFIPTGFPISAWNSKDDGAGTPWLAFKTKYGINANPNTLTFTDLYTIVGSLYMRDLSSSFSSNKVVGGLGNNDQSYFLVAMLNYTVGKIPPIDCVTAATWLAIVAGTYPAVAPWDVGQIGQYLKFNDIVQF